MIRMNTDPISAWLLEKYLDWQRQRHKAASMAEFARHLDVGKNSLNHWVNGHRRPSYASSVKICVRLHDYSLLDLLGYTAEAPDEASIDFLPPALRDPFRLALIELATTFRNRSIYPDSPEAGDLARSTLKRFGFTVTEIE